ncbi:hypothetical protein BGZ61DRAFT_476311 [Ilyonectria robusta]|uniref:uncharacterized protein n=1 Tax=Ilyonectria robusta TaxID=1079257 RepID=UPI001E8D451A|nr:uncharacterized protein BGZ61DRAFT_476311 [Ilyonectria robusta]KAH8714204.1 hypothetical protein BGZ61DRAFT_476311 [Ilyonectria robusta]
MLPLPAVSAGAAPRPLLGLSLCPRLDPSGLCHASPERRSNAHPDTGRAPPPVGPYQRFWSPKSPKGARQTQLHIQGHQRHRHASHRFALARWRASVRVLRPATALGLEEEKAVEVQMRRMSDPTSRTQYSGPVCCPEKGRSHRDAGPAADVELSHFPSATGRKPEARCVDLLCPSFIPLAGYSAHSSNPHANARRRPNDTAARRVATWRFNEPLPSSCDRATHAITPYPASRTALTTEYVPPTPPGRLALGDGDGLVAVKMRPHAGALPVIGSCLLVGRCWHALCTLNLGWAPLSNRTVLLPDVVIGSHRTSHFPSRMTPDGRYVQHPLPLTNPADGQDRGKRIQHPVSSTCHYHPSIAGDIFSPSASPQEGFDTVHHPSTATHIPPLVMPPRIQRAYVRRPTVAQACLVFTPQSPSQMVLVPELLSD